MRGRFSALYRSLLGHDFHPITALAFTSSMSVGAYVLKSMIDERAINAHLPTYREMHEFRDALKQSFLGENNGDESYSQTFNALLEAIVVNDCFTAEEMLTDLTRAGAVTANIRDGLIVFASNHSKIEILELFQQVFGIEAVMRNRHAKKLLSLTAEEKLQLTATVEQFYQSPGKVEYQGMVAFVKAKQKELLEQHLQYRAYQPVYDAYDAATSIAEEYRHVSSVQDITEEMETKFKRTAVVDFGNYPHFEVQVEGFYRELAKSAIMEGRPVVGTMLMAGGHYTLAQIRVVPHPDNFTHASIVYIDSLGSYLSVTTNNYLWIVSVPHHVFDNVKLMISEDKNQFSAVGCSLFVCDQYGTIMSLDQIMSHNTQYEFAGNQDVIFDYAMHAKTTELQYGFDFNVDSGTYAGLNNFHMFVLPASLIVGKQSFENNGVREDTEDMFVLQPNGRYDREVGRTDNRASVLGLMGIERARQASSPERQLEFTKPAGISGTITVEEEIAEHVEPSEHKGAVKPRNRRIQHLAYEYGLFLAKNSDTVLDNGNGLNRRSAGYKQ